MRAWAALLALAASLWAPVAEGIIGIPELEEYVKAERERLEGIEMLVEEYRPRMQMIAQGLADGAVGDCATDCLAHMVEEVEVEGEVWLDLLLLSAIEVAELAGLNPEASFLDAYAASAMATQNTLNESVQNAGGNALITGILGEDALSMGAGDPNAAFMSPFSLMSAGGMLASQAADGVRDAQRSLATTRERAQSNMNQRLDLFSQLREDGPEIVGGVQGSRYATPAINQPLPNNGGPEAVEGELNRAYLVFDPERQVLLKHRTEGTVIRDGQAQEFFIEVVNSDFRNPPGCGDLIWPFRRTTRIGGMMTDEELAQMEQARAQLEEFEQQMASMPAQQRQMMESMMGGQMDAIRSMASGGAMETSQEIEKVHCNPDLALLFGTGMGGEMPGTYDLATIQEYLLILGYEPGNTEGELDTLTEIAISTFQAERGMAVTGQPSLELQQALAAEMG